MASRTIDGRGDTRGYARVEEGAKKEVSGTIGNRGRFAAIALPRSYRPELQQTPSCLSHIYLHTYMHTYLWLVPSCIRAYVHTCTRRSHGSFSARFPTSFLFAFLFSPLLPRVLVSLLWLSVHHRGKCLVAIPSGIDTQYNTDFYTSRLTADTSWNTLHFRLSKCKVSLLRPAEKP